MKKLGLMLFMSIIMLLTACSDPAQDEILSYVNDELPPLAELETEVIGLYDSVTGVNYTDDYTLYDTLSIDIIPMYTEFIGKLEGIRVSDQGLRDIHEDYIAAANKQHGAFVKMLTALENQDVSMIQEVNEILNESRQEMRDYQYDLEAYANEHDVELTDM
jgi:hypothetical protein